MVRKLLHLLVVFMLIGTVPVMAQVDAGPHWRSTDDDYLEWVASERAGPPPWASPRAIMNWRLNSDRRSETEDNNEEDDLGYPPWFTEVEGYEALYKEWVDGGMEGPPPWAQPHAIENYLRSLEKNDETDDDDDGNGPPWFTKQDDVQEWRNEGQQGPPPWAGGRGRKK